ncbi:peptidoglycan bridge formation glycyltransferase FemA/FemB family protein, partial [Candidatus Parcubacteria bacterium]|nr:peptidoglycan bridge formation glycyltransferase FemA/FemB family protein [Candidatus Parcubacteria bacterium]
KEVLKTLLAYILDLAKKEKVSFLRIAPLFLNSPENQEIFKNFKFCEAPIHIHPEVTWILNILSSEDDLLKNMRKTTRYLIKQGEKNPAIEIEEKNDLSGLKTFNEIYQETSKRHQFVPFSFDYLEKEFFTFLKDQQSFLLLGKYKGEPVAGGIFFVWQNICFYHHGASNQKYPKIPVSYLLIWRAIKKAKDLGCSIFNFWGIAPSSNPKHPWTGLSFFKMGFGGEKKEYLKTQDLPLSLKYWLNFFVEKIRKIKRRL